MFTTTVDAMIGETTAAQTAGVPDGLAEMEPGPFLAIVLSGIDVDLLPPDDLITVLRARQRLASHYTAQAYAAMASLVTAYEEENRRGFDDAAWGAAYELRAALHLTRRAADVELGFALDLRDRLPRVFEAFSAGRIDRRRARTIIWRTTHLDEETARAVVDRIIDDAPHLTAGQLAARIQKLSISVDPEAARRRYEHAVAERRVVLEPSDDGTAHLHATDLPPDRAVAARARIDQLARGLRRAGESRTMDQLRADVLLDLLCGTEEMGGRGAVDLRVDLDTLAELSDSPGELAGYGPVVEDVTRRVVAERFDGEWRYTVTHNGRPVATGTTRRRPDVGQQRAVRAARTTCIFPGCRVPADRCDLDHRVEWSRRHVTDVDDLAPLCRHDHRGRHLFGWTYRFLPDGAVEWTAPTGTVHVVRNRDP